MSHVNNIRYIIVETKTKLMLTVLLCVHTSAHTMTTTSYNN